MHFSPCSHHSNYDLPTMVTTKPNLPLRAKTRSKVTNGFCSCMRYQMVRSVRIQGLGVLRYFSQISVCLDTLILQSKALIVKPLELLTHQSFFFSPSSLHFCPLLLAFIHLKSQCKNCIHRGSHLTMTMTLGELQPFASSGTMENGQPSFLSTLTTCYCPQGFIFIYSEKEQFLLIIPILLSLKHPLNFGYHNANILQYQSTMVMQHHPQNLSDICNSIYFLFSQ